MMSIVAKNKPLEQILTENNKKIFEYFDIKMQELAESLGYKEKLKQWNKDLFKFSMEHRA